MVTLMYLRADVPPLPTYTHTHIIKTNIEILEEKQTGTIVCPNLITFVFEERKRNTIRQSMKGVNIGSLIL